MSDQATVTHLRRRSDAAAVLQVTGALIFSAGLGILALWAGLVALGLSLILLGVSLEVGG